MNRAATVKEQDDFLAMKKKEADTKRNKEKAERLHEEKRKQQDQKLAEQTRMLEEQWLEEQRNKENARLAEQKAEDARLVEEKRQKEKSRIAEQKIIEEARLANQKKIKQEKLAEQKMKEDETKLVEKKKQEGEEATLVEQMKKYDKFRVAEQEQKEEEANIDHKRREEETKLADQMRKVKVAEQKRKEEQARLLEQVRKEEEAKILEQKQEEKEIAEQKKHEEEARLAEQKLQVELAEQKAKVQQEKLAEQQRILAEQMRQDEEAKIAEQKMREAVKLADQKKKDEQAKLVEQKKREEITRLADQEKIELRKLAEQKKKDDEAKLAEQKKKDERVKLEKQQRKEEEARLAEQKRKDKQRLVQEQLQAEKRKLEEHAKRETVVKEAKLQNEKLAQQRREEQEKVQADFRKEQLERISKVKFVNGEKKLDDERRAEEIGRAQAEIEGYSVKQASGTNHGAENPDVHLAVVACGDRLEETMVLLKSARLFSRVHLHFHVFAEQELKPKFNEQLEAWPEDVRKQTTFDVYSLKFPTENEEEWKKLFKPCASQRLFLPDLLPNLDSVLYLDTDILFMRPPEDIWRFFRRFNSSQLAALAPEHEDANIGWYNRFARHPYYPPLGVNSGVMLMNLTRMRSVDWVKAMIPYHKEYKYRITWGDQDLINIYFHFRPEMLYIYPCHWNFRPDHCMYMSICKPANMAGANLVHGSRRVWFTDKQPAFKVIYNAFKAYKFEDNLDEGLLRPITANMAAFDVQNTNCGKNYQGLTKQLQTQAGLAKVNKKQQKWVKAGKKNTSKDSKSSKKGLEMR